MEIMGNALKLVAGVGFVIFFHELGHFMVAKWRGIKVEKFSLGFGPRIAGFTYGETEYRISWLPLGGYVKMAGENPEESLKGDASEFLGQPWWSRLLVVLAGPGMNVVLALLLFSVILMVGAKEPVIEDPVIDQVMSSDSPAGQAGLRSGDRILSINGEATKTWQEMTTVIRAHPGVALTLEVARENEQISAVVTPRSVGEGDQKVGQLGVQGRVTRHIDRRYPPMEAIKMAGKITWGIAKDFGGTITKLLKREMNVKDSIRGPVGIVDIAVKEIKSGLLNFLWFLAVISVNLAVVNLLPIPVLDGGHVMMLAIEAVRRKPLSLKTQIIFQQVGLALLLTLVLYTTLHDVLRLR